MDGCCICGQEIDFMKGYVPFVVSGKSRFLCYDCHSMKTKLEGADSTAKDMALAYFKKMNASGRSVKGAYDSIVGEYERALAAKELEFELEKKRREARQELEEKRRAFLSTTGIGFDGYRIKRHIKIVSGEAVLGTGLLSELSASVSDAFGTRNNSFENKVSLAKDYAQERMMRKALTYGANAVLGVDFDLMTLGNNMIVVSANGTAVEVEKIVE